MIKDLGYYFVGIREFMVLSSEFQVQLFLPSFSLGWIIPSDTETKVSPEPSLKAGRKTITTSSFMDF